MKYLHELIRHQRRSIFIFAIIAACLVVNVAWRTDWPQALGSIGIGSQTEKVVEPKMSNSDKSDTLTIPRQDIRPDYVLPAVSDDEVPVVNRIPTAQRVVFLTIDDGMTKTPDALRLLAQYHIKAPMFLNDVYVQEKPTYFKKLINQGMTAESHTVDHADLTTLGYEQQTAEICDNTTHIQTWLGVRPTLFRPPYGSYNDSVLKAAAACGMRAAVMWSAKANGGSMQYQDGHTGLVPGDIVLMHFRPEFAKDFQAFIDAAKSAGLQPENLEDWLRAPRPIPGQASI